MAQSLPPTPFTSSLFACLFLSSLKMLKKAWLPLALCCSLMLLPFAHCGIEGAVEGEVGQQQNVQQTVRIDTTVKQSVEVSINEAQAYNRGRETDVGGQETMDSYDHNEQLPKGSRNGEERAHEKVKFVNEGVAIMESEPSTVDYQSAEQPEPQVPIESPKFHSFDKLDTDMKDLQTERRLQRPIIGHMGWTVKEGKKREDRIIRLETGIAALNKEKAQKVGDHWKSADKLRLSIREREDAIREHMRRNISLFLGIALNVDTLVCTRAQIESIFSESRRNCESAIEANKKEIEELKRREEEEIAAVEKVIELDLEQLRQNYEAQKRALEEQLEQLKASYKRKTENIRHEHPECAQKRIEIEARYRMDIERRESTQLRAKLSGMVKLEATLHSEFDTLKGLKIALQLEEEAMRRVAQKKDHKIKAEQDVLDVEEKKRLRVQYEAELEETMQALVTCLAEVKKQHDDRTHSCGCHRNQMLEPRGECKPYSKQGCQAYFRGANELAAKLNLDLKRVSRGQLKKFMLGLKGTVGELWAQKLSKDKLALTLATVNNQYAKVMQLLEQSHSSQSTDANAAKRGFTLFSQNPKPQN